MNRGVMAANEDIETTTTLTRSRLDQMAPWGEYFEKFDDFTLCQRTTSVVVGEACAQARNQSL
jgi:hypothetical protein